MRLDRAVVARGLARSRTHAQKLIADGAVLVNTAPVTRASYLLDPHATLSLVGEADTYVSRAAHKLAGALDRCVPLGLNVEGASALDAGASTGGFTQVLLERGVASVVAIDVGHDQLSPHIRDHPRVTSYEGVNVRSLTRESPGAGVDLVVADLSFISLTLVIGALVQFAQPRADFVLMVKPQFEVGRSALGKNGVVTQPERRRHAVAGVVESMQQAGLVIHHISRSVLPGPRGNVEFFVWASSAWQARDISGQATEPPVLDHTQIAHAIAHEVEGAP